MSGYGCCRCNISVSLENFSAIVGQTSQRTLPIYPLHLPIKQRMTFRALATKRWKGRAERSEQCSKQDLNRPNANTHPHTQKLFKYNFEQLIFAFLINLQSCAAKLEDMSILCVYTTHEILSSYHRELSDRVSQTKRRKAKISAPMWKVIYLIALHLRYGYFKTN